MIFENFIQKLKNNTFEELCKGTNVECIGNKVYDDDDLYDFLATMDASIEDYCVGYVIISANDKMYEVPYVDEPNRFGNDLPDETILSFNYNEIYDITENY